MISCKEYRANVREFRLEEPFDYLLYRPLAYLIVRMTWQLPLTPNRFSLASLVVGLWAGFALASGHWLAGGIGIFVFSVLDCCDGMLARMKGNGSRLGVFIDMLVDAIVNIGFYLGLYLGLSAQPHAFPLSMLAPLSLVAITVHASAYHYYKKQLLSYMAGNPHGRREEIEAFRREYEALKRRPGAHGEKLLYRLFLLFSRLQRDDRTMPVYDVSRYGARNKDMLALWGVIAGSSHLTVLAAALIGGAVTVYFWYALLFANGWFIVMMAVQHRINERLREVA